MRELFKQHASELRANLGRFHGESLVRALGVDLERPRSAESVRAVFDCLRGDVGEVLLAHAGTAERRDSENLAHAVNDFSEVDVLVKRSDIRRGLRTRELKMSEAFESALDVLGEHILEGLFVESLEDHFAVFYKNYLFHNFLLYYYNI